MKTGSFIINGISSEELNTVIQSRPLLVSPKRKIDMKEGYGHDGLLPYDEEVYENTPLSLLCYTNGKNASESRRKIFSVLNNPGYSHLRMYCDEEKIYRVMLNEPIKFESRYYMGEGFAFEAEFTVKPYKYMIDSPTKILTSHKSIYNKSGYTSLPRITIYGSGTIKLLVNNVEFSMKNVSNHIILDSETMFAYRKISDIIENQNQNAYTRKYPILEPGYSDISWVGNVSKIEIEPRWRSLT